MRSLQTVDIPKGVTAIGAEAFSGCAGLRSVQIPDGVTGIESGTFSSCRALESVQLPDGLTSIGEDAFFGCGSLETLDLPKGLTSIAQNAFYGCGALQVIALPDGLASMGQNAFRGCSSLRSINIPKGLTSLEKDVFSDSGLEAIAIPSNVESIGENAFMGCGSLASVDIAYGVTSIGAYAFSGCRKLNAVNIAGSVKSIGNCAFWYCVALEEVVVPEGVASIGKRAFDGFTNEQRILLPKSLTDMADEALGVSGTSSRAKIYVYRKSYAEDFCKAHDIPYKYRNGYESAKVSLSFAEKTLSQKESAKLKPGTEGLKEKYSFASSDANIASVSKTGGKITARNPGTAIITATGKTSGADASCTITVLPAPESVEITGAPESSVLNLGGIPLQLGAIVKPAGAAQEVTWKSSKPKVASVDKNTGLVTAHREGRVTITATARHKKLNGKSASGKIALTVVDPKRPTAIHVDPETPTVLEMKDGRPVTQLLKYTLEPADTAETEVTWSIPKKAHRSYASVTREGELTAKKAGKVQLKVTAKKKSAAGKTLSATIEITIVDPTIPTSVTITESDGAPITQIKQIKKGEKLALRAACTPETAANAELEWSSSNQKVAKVNKSTGEITAVGKGKAQITAKAKKGGRKASVTVQVIQ